MNTIDTSQLLGQLRAAAAQAQGQSQPAQPATGGGENFSSLLTQSIDKVNEMQTESKELKTAFQLGDPNVSLPDVMMAGNKASLAFQAMTTTRNKMVEAYQEIMRMQV